MFRSYWMSCLLTLTAAPLAAQMDLAPARAERQVLVPTATRAREALTRTTVNYTISVRKVFFNQGSAVDILFDAAQGATTYTLRRASAREGPYTTLPPSQARLSTNNTAVNPPCCEVMDVEAYKVGVGQTVWYVLDAWDNNTLIKSTDPIRIDLPSWFRGPLRVDVAKTGNDQWTIGWEAVEGAFSYLVSVKIDGTTINLLSSPNIPPGQTQINLSGLYPGTRYSVFVSGSFMWDGQRLTRDGTTWYTAP